ncbi:MAG TPA: alkaline phosphatase D family protein [Kofleriaceae bacterium]|nr:alkaline phosphatase D family protein [Kofleriaceae bacterium]
MNRVGLTRRDVLRIAGIGSASLIVGCGDNERPRDAGNSHAAFVVEPDESSFIVVVWSSEARTVALEVQSGDAIVMSTVMEISEIGSFDVTGLAASTNYQVHLVFDTGVELGPHHVRTAPLADDPRPVRIAVSADVDPNLEFDSELLAHCAAASPEVFVSIGDFPYADNGPDVAVTVDAYRNRYAQTVTAPRQRAWLQAMAVRAIYDDHEFRNDFDGMYRVAEASRYAAAMQVWDEFFPVRGAAGEIRYRAFRWGAHVDCIMLDCRRFRSANAAPDDANKTMLGDTQRAWLIDTLESSTATFKLVFTSVPLDFADGNDHWAAYTYERSLIFDALVGIPGILFVSADQHWFAAHKHAHGIREFQVGPVCRGIGTPHVFAPGVLFRSMQYNFALIDVDGEQLTFSGVGPDGVTFYKETLTPQALTPQP